MRAIFLNSWFGKAGKPFFDFIKSESSRTDIFCFMEFTPELFTKMSEILVDHRGFIEKGMVLEPWGIIDCQVIFARKNLEITSSGRLALYDSIQENCERELTDELNADGHLLKQRGNPDRKVVGGCHRNTPGDTGFASYIVFKDNGKTVNLLNVHGKSQPGHKMDTPARLKQSKIVINFFKDKKGFKIIGGDFNLNPDTKSIALFEEAGYKNLIKDFGIKNTRNKLSWEQFNNVQHFADYVFVSKDVKVNEFKVPYNEISDHLPQILDFSFDSAQD